MSDGSESDDDDLCWQVASSIKAKKRHIIDPPTTFTSKRKNINNKQDSETKNDDNVSTLKTKNDNNNINKWNADFGNEASTSNLTAYKNKHVSQNRFSILEDNESNTIHDNDIDFESGEDKTPTSNPPKPPPIFIPNVSNVSAMTKSFSNVISPSSYNYKALRDGHIRIMVKEVLPYRALVSFLNDKKIEFHTYQLKQERAYRAVIKNLHPSTDKTDIEIALESLGHKVRNVSNMYSKITKEALPMFIVDLEPNTNNKNVFDIKVINNAVVNIVPPKKSTDIVQCHRCQEYGHTKTYCRKFVKCVKCGLGHLTVDCTKEENTPPRCVNCLQNHPASYKGCIVYRQLLKTKLQNNISHRRHNYVNYNYKSQDYPPLHNKDKSQNYNQNNIGFSYSEVLKSSQQGTQQSSFEKLESLIQNQIELTNKLLNMITVLVTKLCN